MEQSLNTDVLRIIAGGDPSVYPTLATVSKGLRDLVMSVYNERHRRIPGTDIVLYFHQSVVRDLFFQMPIGTMTLRALKSFGKTYTGYACLDGLGVVLATAAHRVWTTHAKKMGWYDRDPNETQVLCVSDSERHRKYAERLVEIARRRPYRGTTYEPPSEDEIAGFKEAINTDRFIIIATDHHASLAHSIMDLIKTEKPKVLVVDEAATVRNAVRDAQFKCKWHMGGRIYDKQLLMSADYMNIGNVLGPGDHRVYRSIYITGREGDVPKIVWHIEQSDPDIVETAISTISQYSKVAISAVGFLLDKIAYYGQPEKDPNSKAKRLQNKTFYNTKLYYQKSSADTIDYFNYYEEDALLLINSNVNKGDNIHADALVIMEAGEVNTDRITQTVGRVIRTTNNVDEVHVYLFAENEHYWLRCHYARCFYNEAWNEAWSMWFDNLPDHRYLRKCVSIIKLMGISVADVSSADGIMIFVDTLNVKSPLTLLEWWKANKTADTVLTEDMVADLLCM